MAITTERIFFKKPQSTDLVCLHSCFGDYETTKYWRPGVSLSLADTQVRLAAMIDHWEQHGFGDWILTEKLTGKFIGFCGLHFIDAMEEVNVGYMLEKSNWGLGYATEAVIASVQFGFHSLTLKKIVAVIQPPNKASKKVAERAGLIFWKNIVWQSSPRIVYSVSNPNLGS